jgi:hypothetical protein
MHPGSRGPQNDTRDLRDDPEFQNKLDQNKGPVGPFIPTVKAIF